ncbi:MAG: glycosyltransferase family 9 protein [Bacteroidetes bacterium]|nr:glycosyltransferase family 9 protein [Bacteroidota bacterium]
MQKILIIQTAFIGDVVLATCLVEKLHQFLPGAQIDFLVRKGNEPLFNGHPYLNEILIWDKKKNKQKNLFGLLKRIRKTKYDKVINVQRFAATGMLTAFSGAKERIGFDKNPFSFLFTKKIKHIVSNNAKPVHEIERDLELINFFTDDSITKPRLYPSQNDYETVSFYQHHPYITIAPASVWFTKQYPKEKWVSFLKKLPAGYSVLLLGAPSDKNLCEEIIAGSSRSFTTNLCGQLSFLQSAALMQNAVMNFVNDSAPMHFASSVNAPVTAVYCSTVPAFGFGPLSDNRHIVEVIGKLDCRPCGLHGYKACPKGHFNCAMKIEDGQLLQTIA